MPSDQSDIREWWTLLEVSAPEGWLVTFSLIQICKTAREAAERSAGFQLAEGWRPRRLMVYPAAPYVFEWVQVRPYIMQVGKELDGSGRPIDAAS